MPSKLIRTVRDSFFWYSAGMGWRNRWRLLQYWLSPRVPRLRTGSTRADEGLPTPVRTRFRGGKPFHLRSRSTDVRLLRHIFGHAPYHFDKATTEIQTVVDLGANIGLSTLYFADQHPDARIVAVEPDAGSYACLKRNVETIDRPERVRTVRACISDSTGTERFSSDGPSWARRIVVGDDVGVEVPSLTLADLLDQCHIDFVDLLKMDIEGGEQRALRTAGAWLDRVGWLMMELHLTAVSFNELLSTMKSARRPVFVRPTPTTQQWVDVNEAPEVDPAGDFAGVDLLIGPTASRP